MMVKWSMFNALEIIKFKTVKKEIIHSAVLNDTINMLIAISFWISSNWPTQIKKL